MTLGAAIGVTVPVISELADKNDTNSIDSVMSAMMKPSGFAALGGLILPFALVIPSTDQVWYVGPIAKVTGDLGFEFAFITSILIYLLLRTIEIKYFRGGRL
jgi:purine-cytosine permease-like protein